MSPSHDKQWEPKTGMTGRAYRPSAKGPEEAAACLAIRQPARSEAARPVDGWQCPEVRVHQEARPPGGDGVERTSC